MDRLTAIKIKYEDGTYSDEIPIYVTAENVEYNNEYSLIETLGYIDIKKDGNIQQQINKIISISAKIPTLENRIANIQGGTPTVVDDISDMIDTDQIYILSTDSKWYYYDLTSAAWIAGGVYGGVPTDKTLTQFNMAADSKIVGENISDINWNLTKLLDGNHFAKKEIDTGTWEVGSVTSSGIKPSVKTEAHSGIFNIGNNDYIDVVISDNTGCKFIVYRYDGTNYSITPLIRNKYIPKGGIRLTDKTYSYIIRLVPVPSQTITNPTVYKEKIKAYGGSYNNLLYLTDTRDIFDKKIDVEFDIPKAQISVSSSDGYTESNSDVCTVPISIRNYDSIVFEAVNTGTSTGDCHFAVYSYNGTVYTLLTGGWTTKTFEFTDKTVDYILRISMVGVTNLTVDQFLEVCNSVKIHLQIKDSKHNPMYGYDRQYTDITSSLTFERKSISASGIIDSETALLAKLPNDGNIECRLNRPAGKFSIWKSSGTGFILLSDEWTYYQYRYTGDYISDYYIMIATSNENAITLNSYYIVAVYKYLDIGTLYNSNLKLSGKNIAVFGDSIVQGRFAKNGTSVNCTMPKPYSNLLSEIAGTEAHNFGIGGALVYDNDWKSLSRNYIYVTGYDVVFVCAGTNDFGQSISLTDFSAAYETIITNLVASNTEVVVCTPTRRSTNETKGGNTLQNFADVEISIAEENNVKVIDLYSLTNNDQFRNQLSDGLHPNEIGAKMIADLIVSNY